ncbi:E3 ubiquitin-protein ligase SH3RF1 [Triplophysa rosa]|uniref:E3 ubiquitin-protein ligase SH3RF1 n=1 Tax=Triplophysa rosa TaxID=992332 RepID=A0A9W7WII0_TRIRA|nr:E3 ubiquitin-protein ligase SH3RF1 [Triplophysa rosa]XP_057208998.1 E3 ubiquitin-protein ligase SH3RF1 [Triplophysa rosa]XP_057208999.1 E3 ubiquitin-protein ligase SH3RF1 [Triplophysa rosa]KAI7800280.1 E3 ubiquitin-protein ligase SH3RF1 [Triplophysa rosa]
MNDHIDKDCAKMDESALLDLLECPVCLERLDATAKVLPCQHTFCRRCLLGIVGSRGELRCPECRTLVESGVDELPSNILLVRLLDGIKQRPRRTGTAHSPCTNGTTGAGVRGQASGGGQRDQGPTGTQPQRAQAKTTPVRGVPQLPCAKALYNYDGKEPGDLKFSKGDIIILRRQVDENWYHGEMGGVHGFFPTNFVQVIKPLPQPPPQCKALYDFELKDKEADKDCLPFSKDDILTVIRRVDENWAEGMLGEKIGIFPISYVEFNSAARQLIELDKPSEGVGDASEGPSFASSGPQANGSQKPTGEKKNSKKRHSFTSLTMSHKPCLAPPPQRHSMEISGPVLISSSNPTAAARIGELSGGLSSSAPSQVHICTTGLIVTPPPSSPVTTATVFTFPPETSYASLSVDALPPPPPPPPQSHSTAVGAVTSNGGQRPLPAAGEQSGRQRPTVYVAMFPYTPRKEDELELRKGEMFLVLERCQDGWFKGTSMHTGKIGVFPGNYMSPVSRTGSSQPKVPLTLCSQTGRGVTIVSPSPAPLGAILGSIDPSKPLPICPNPAPTCSLPAAIVTAAHIPTGQTPKVLMHVTSQMTVNQARSVVRTAVCHSQDRPTAAVMPIQSHNPMGYHPNTAACLQPSPVLGSSPGSSSGRMVVAMGCAAASLTPPNVNAASLDSDAMRPITVVAIPGNTKSLGAGSNNSAACKLDKDCKREKKGLLKLLSNKKKLRPSPPSSPTLEAEQTVAMDMPQGAVGPEMAPPSSVVIGVGNNGRVGPCPVEFELSVSSSSSSSTEAASHRSNSQDNTAPIAPPPRQPCSSLLSMNHDGRPIVCERYRVVVSYPPQSEAELELKEGDIVFVHRKREDGWFKGTLQRNGRTGLFPGSFVDSI